MSEIKVPELGESIVEATILNWLKNEGDAVGQGEAVAELETDKVNVEVISDEAGVLQSILKAAGETVAVGEAIAVVGAGAAGTASAPSAAQTEPAKPAPQPAPAPSPAPAAAPIIPTATAQTHAGVAPRSTPSMRRMALEQGVDVSQLQSQAAGPAPSVQTQVQAKPAAVTVPSVNAVGTDRPDEDRQKMSRRRLTIAKRLVEVQHTAAMLTTFNEVDMSSVMAVRKRRKDKFKEEHGVGLGFMSFFTKAVVGALKAYPLLNAEIQGEDMIVKHHYDIGVAVATESGLVVPVVKDADRMSFAEIEKEIGRLAVKARENTLSLGDLQGGTFTITNGGVFGSLFSTPILNSPQVGILGMHGIQERPIAVNGQVVIRPMMYIALSYDHRIVDGSEAVRFLVKIKQLIEDPESLLLEG